MQFGVPNRATSIQRTMSVHKQPSEAQLMFAYAEMEQHRTHHLLHLGLSIVTVGLWLVIWLAVSVRNTQRRNRIARDYGLPAESNIGYIIIFFLLFSSVAVGVYQVYLTLLTGAQAEAAKVTDQPAVQQTKQETHWTYAKEKDRMGLGTSAIATTYSLNEIEFGPPYKGKQRAVLILRQYPDNSHDAYLGLLEGQFDCNSRACGISARFDNGLTQYFESWPPANDKTPGLYLSNADIFIQFTEEANVLTITADFFDEPSQTFQFDVSGLTWE